MAFAIKKVNTITQIVRLKQVMKRWKTISLKLRSGPSDSDSDSDSIPTRKRIPSGSLAVYVGLERRRFVIPTRFLNLPLFVSLLDKAEEEYGFQSSGGLVLPCEVDFFKGALKLLERDEQRFGGIGFDEFLSMFSDPGLDSCKDSITVRHGFTPLLQKIRV